MTLNLDGASVRSEADFHQAVREASQIDFYGANLDALWDVLVHLVEPPIEIRWVDAGASRDSIGPRFDRIAEVMREAQARVGRSCFALELDL